jgi:hypothetical protein
MKKEEIIKRYGGNAYEKLLEQRRQWALDNPDRQRENCRNWYLDNSVRQRENQRNWQLTNPDKARKNSEEQCRKGGKRYLKTLRYRTTGLQGERNRIRALHGHKWREYKKIIAPESQLHHQWIPETANYEGVALVETDLHMRGIINVIKILKGKITLLTEKEIKEQEVALWTA